LMQLALGRTVIHDDQEVYLSSYRRKVLDIFSARVKGDDDRCGPFVHEHLIPVFAGCRFSGGGVPAMWCTRRERTLIPESTLDRKTIGNVHGLPGHRFPKNTHRV